VGTTTEQSVSELTRRIAELTARVADLAQRIESRESPRAADSRLRDETTNLIAGAIDDDGTPIEFITENGFSITRPWEVKGSPAPPDARFGFLVSDPAGTEREVFIEIDRRLCAETELRTRQRILRASSFWVCCAERHLANYVTEHDAFPPAGGLTVEALDREEVLLAIRWDKSG